MVRIFGLRLGALPAIIGQVARGRRVWLIEDVDCGPLTRWLLGRLAGQLRRRGLACSAAELVPAERRYFVEGWSTRSHDLFAKVEPTLEQFLRFDRAHGAGDYAGAVRHAGCQYAERRFSQISLIEELETAFAPSEVSVEKVDSSVRTLFEAYHGRRPTIKVTEATSWHLAANALTTLVVLAAAIAWIVRRLRPRVKSAPAVRLGVDFIAEYRTAYMVTQIVDRPEDALLVSRSRAIDAEVARYEGARGYRRVAQGDGVLTAAEALDGLALLIGGWWKLFGSCGRLPSALYFEVAKLPMRRLEMRVLLSRNPVRAFLAKDDYNAEHLIRSLELRRIGALSLGINHGVTAPSVLAGLLRHLDFDIYYSFGRFPFDRFYRQKWPKEMRLSPVGTFGATREQLARICGPRSQDIAVFISRLEDEADVLTALAALARRMPDRKVWLKMKYPPGHRHHMPLPADDLPSNLCQTWGNPYDLMLDSAYVLSSGNSSVAVEAIQLGAICFVLDHSGQRDQSYYRHFDGLCISTIEEFGTKIEAIESGQLEYRREGFADLVDLSGRVIFDTIRADIGLSPGQ